MIPLQAARRWYLRVYLWWVVRLEGRWVYHRPHAAYLTLAAKLLRASPIGIRLEDGTILWRRLTIDDSHGILGYPDHRRT